MSDRGASTTQRRPGERLIVSVVTAIDQVDRAVWDGLDHGPSPFLRHGFLAALEDSGSIGGRSGWTPLYLVVRAGEGADAAVLAATAAFVKRHSYGEYIFDWSWANAAQRAGVPYYPKIVVAAPMTPATGRRILLAPGADADTATAALASALRSIADDVKASSIHWLFCTADEQARLTRLGFAPRASFQYHWHNRGYRDFDGFLGALASRKRKQLRKERQRARAAVDGLVWVPGRALSSAQLDDLDRWYRTTTDNHGGSDYLRPGFFHRLAETLPDEMLVAEVAAGGERMAGALFFETAHGLYGRYWGADRHVEFLHFETAYYAGVERAIARGLPLFEAGAQGEHKLLRGFLPSPTYSAHWLRHEGLHAAIEVFLAREAAALRLEMASLAEASPYRRDGGDGDAATPVAGGEP
jgi:predicted N-acyltransferase